MFSKDNSFRGISTASQQSLRARCASPRFIASSAILGSMTPKRRKTIDDAMVGTRLRQARLACGMSLKAVEALSAGALPAATVSFYERGERPVTAPRLYQLAEIYGVPLADLMGPGQPGPLERSHTIGSPIRLDLAAIEKSSARDAKVLSGLIKEVQHRRASNSPESIALRHDDLVTTAATVGKSLDSFVTSLRKAGVIRRSRGRPPRV